MSARSRIVLHRCLRCRRRYRPWSSGQAYCRLRCYWDARRRVPERRFCAQPGCGKSFLVGGRGHPGRRQLFHDKSCASKAREARALRLPRARRLKISDRRWLACLIDGEGHLPRRGKAVFIEVGNTSLPYLLEAWRMCGAGSIRKDRPVPGELPFWRWRVGRVDSVALLRQAAPHLKIKMRDAMRLIALYERRRRVPA